LEELVAGLLRPRLFPFGKLSKAKSAAHTPYMFIHICRLILAEILKESIQIAHTIADDF
jgi:hypothetical protein